VLQCDIGDAVALGGLLVGAPVAGMMEFPRIVCMVCPDLSSPHGANEIVTLMLTRLPQDPQDFQEVYTSDEEPGLSA
jgi:hypothetical protein